MSNLVKRIDAHFIACAAAAGAAMVGTAQKAEAGIVYSGVVNIPIQGTTNGLYINVQTYPAAGSINEPGNTTGTSVPGWDINWWSSTGGSIWFGTGGGGVAATAGGAHLNLSVGTLIDAASLYSTTTGGGAAAFSNTVPGILGFKFVAADTLTHYGWARFTKAASATAPGNLIDFAYDDVAGAGINAGAVPAPGSLALLALGAAGLLGRRRK